MSQEPATPEPANPQQPKVHKVVQILWRCEDSENDIWLDICTELMPAVEADILFRVLTSYNRVGQQLARHVLAWPNEYSTFDGLTKLEVEELRTMNNLLPTYMAYAPPANAPILVVGRYVVEITPDF